MKANIQNLDYFDGLHKFRKESSFWKQISAIDPGTGRESVIARWYGSGSTAYCCIWVHGAEKHGSGAGKAGGYGYHKPSAALQVAIEKAGIRLDQAIDGRGDQAMESAIEAIAKAVTGKRMKTVFFNWKGPQGRETVDEFTPEPGQTWREIRAYVREMVGEYHMAGMDVYTSSRRCANWKGE